MPTKKKATQHVAALPFRAIGKKPARAKFLRLLFLNWVSPFLRNRIRYVPRSSHTNTFGTFEWFAEQTVPGSDVVFAIGDDSDKFKLSEVAGRHWLTIALSAIHHERRDFSGWCALYGYELGTIADVKSLLGKVDNPLVEVPFEGKAWLVAAVCGDPTTIVCDVDVGPASFADLDAKGRAAVTRVSKSGLCECFLCVKLRRKRKV